MWKDSSPGDPLPEIIKAIDQDRINQWAEISGDFNRLHVDPDFAKNTPFRGTIAHGPMSLAFLNELMMRWAGLSWTSGGRLLDVRFRAPVRPGERIRISGFVRERGQTGQGLFIKCEVFIEKANGDRAVVGWALVPLDMEG
jgi:3-hydroxybutyryl-CoA dehydratase